MGTWEDINPPMASAPRSAPLSTFSASLTPATKDEFRSELTKCLALVVPAGMDEAARRDWLSVAWETLHGLPGDLLRIGAAKARLVADHPAKIVPAIMDEVSGLLRQRQDMARDGRERRDRLAPPSERHVMERRGEPMSAEDTAALNAELERLGATARYREDGSKYFIERAA